MPECGSMIRADKVRSEVIFIGDTLWNARGKDRKAPATSVSIGLLHCENTTAAAKSKPVLHDLWGRRHWSAGRQTQPLTHCGRKAGNPENHQCDEDDDDRRVIGRLFQQAGGQQGQK
jgi:hypothetical protein